MKSVSGWRIFICMGWSSEATGRYHGSVVPVGVAESVRVAVSRVAYPVTLTRADDGGGRESASRMPLIDGGAIGDKRLNIFVITRMHLNN